MFTIVHGMLLLASSVAFVRSEVLCVVVVELDELERDFTPVNDIQHVTALHLE